MPSTPKPKDTLLSYIRVQENLDRRTYTMLRAAASDVEKQLRGLASRQNIGAVIRRDQLEAVHKAMLQELQRIAQKHGLLVQAAKYDAAQAAIKTFIAYDRMLMRAVSSEDLIKAYLNGAQVASRAGIDAAEQRLLGASYRPLAESVYKTLQLQTGQVDRLVTSALARGLSARELAKEAVDLIKPSVRGGVSYASMRLGRTEINNAFHATSAQKARQTPWVEGVVWHLSGSHPRPDQCNEYAENDVAGRPEGFFLPDDIPSKPHPNCLCYTTPEVEDDDTFLDKFFAGSYDDYLSQFN